MIGIYCRAYRKSKGVLLQEVSVDLPNMKLMSAFEHGRSSNFIHIKPYIRIAEQHNETQEFAMGLIEAIKNV